MTMAEMTMISMAVMAATQQSRSFWNAAAGRKDLYLEEGPLEEGILEIGTLGIGTLGIGTLEKADVIYLPDYSSLDFRQVRKLLKAGKHVLFGTMGAADAGSLKALAQTADEHGAVLLDHIHLAFNPCMASLKTALTCLGPIGGFVSIPVSMPSAVRGYAFLLSVPRLRSAGRRIVSEGRRLPLSPCASLRHTGTDGCQMVFTEHGMDAAGTVRGYLGTGPSGDSLFQDIRKPCTKSDRGRKGEPVNT